MHSHSTAHRHSNENDFVWWLISKVLTCHVNTFTLQEQTRKKMQLRLTAACVALNLLHQRLRPNLIYGKEKKNENKAMASTAHNGRGTRIPRSTNTKKDEFSSHETRTESNERQSIHRFPHIPSCQRISSFLLGSEWKHGKRQNNSRFGNMKCNQYPLAKNHRQRKILIYRLNAVITSKK